MPGPSVTAGMTIIMTIRDMDAIQDIMSTITTTIIGNLAA